MIIVARNLLIRLMALFAAAPDGVGFRICFCGKTCTHQATVGGDVGPVRTDGRGRKRSIKRGPAPKVIASRQAQASACRYARIGAPAHSHDVDPARLARTHFSAAPSDVAIITEPGGQFMTAAPSALDPTQPFRHRSPPLLI